MVSLFASKSLVFFDRKLLLAQVYNWLPANLMLGVTIQGGVEILLVASCYGNRDKLRPVWATRHDADLTFLNIFRE